MPIKQTESIGKVKAAVAAADCRFRGRTEAGCAAPRPYSRNMTFRQRGVVVNRPTAGIAFLKGLHRARGLPARLLIDRSAIETRIPQHLLN